MNPFTRTPAGYETRLDPGMTDLLVGASCYLLQVMGEPIEPIDDPLVALEFQPESTDPAIMAMVSGQPTAHAPGSDDPVLTRLLPPMSVEDPDLAAELRAQTYSRVAARKAEQLRNLRDCVIDDTGLIVIPTDQAAAILAALSDIRLLIANRLELQLGDEVDHLQDIVWDITGDTLSHHGGRQLRILVHLYRYATWWQASLEEILGDELPAA